MPKHMDAAGPTTVNITAPFNGAGVGAADRAAFVGVFDIGQGGFNGVFGADGRPFLYYDMGGGIGGLLYTYPQPAPQFCNSALRMIVQSHFDEDHYKTCTLPAFRALLAGGMHMVIPRQPMGIFGGATLDDVLLRLVDVHYWPIAGLTWVRLGATGVDIIKCIGAGKNHNGLAVRIEDPGAANHWVVLPADVHFDPDLFPWDINGHDPDLQVIGISPSHHGARENADHVPRALLGAVRVSAYSLGAGNLFGHPFHEPAAAAGDGVAAYLTSGYVDQGRMQTSGRPISVPNGGPRGSNLAILLSGADQARQGRDPYHAGGPPNLPRAAIALVAAASTAAHQASQGNAYADLMPVAAAWQAATEHHTLREERPVADYLARRGVPAAPIVAAAGAGLQAWLAASLQGNHSADAVDAAVKAGPVARGVAQLVAAAATEAAAQATTLALNAHLAGGHAKTQMNTARRAVLLAVNNGSVPRVQGTNSAQALTGPAASLRCHAPMGLAFDAASGHLLVADTGNSTIGVLDYADGTLLRLAGAPGREGDSDGTGIAARFCRPHGLALRHPTLFIADTGNHTVRALDVTTGAVTTFAGTAQVFGNGDGQGAAMLLNAPRGLAHDPVLDRLYVADTGNHTIRAIDSAGTGTTIAGAPGNAGAIDGRGAAARFNGPAGLALGATGLLYVADQVNHTIRKIAPRGSCITLAGVDQARNTVDGSASDARFNRPAGVAADGAGGFYIADALAHCIRHLSAAGMVTTVAGMAGVPGNANGPGATALFNGPTGLAYAIAAQRLWVADTGNHAIRTIDMAGGAQVATPFGTGVAGHANDVGNAASFNGPVALVLGVTNLIVADRDNHTIRNIDFGTGNVTTLAGSPGFAGPTDGQGAAARLHSPAGLAVANGVLWIADAGNTMLRSMDPACKVVSHACAGIASVAGLAAVANRLYVSDPANHVVHEVVNGNPNLGRTQIGQPAHPGNIDGRAAAVTFRQPAGAAIDPQTGNLVIVDADAATVRMITVAVPWVVTLAGQAGQAGAIDGTCAAARFNQPVAVAAKADGTLHIADAGNNVIRTITPAGAVTTLAGAFNMPADTDGAAAAARFRRPAALALHNHDLYVADQGSDRIRCISGGNVGTVPDVNISFALAAWLLAHGAAGPPAAYPGDPAITALATTLCERAAQAYCMTLAASFGGPASDPAGVIRHSRQPPEAAAHAWGSLVAIPGIEAGVVAAIAAAAALGPAVETQTTGVVVPGAAFDAPGFEQRLLIAAVAALVGMRQGTGTGADNARAAVAAARAASAAARGAPLVGCHRHPSSCGASVCSLMIHEFG